MYVYVVRACVSVSVCVHAECVVLRYLRAAVHRGLDGGHGVVGLGGFADVGVEFGAGHVVPPARLRRQRGGGAEERRGEGEERERRGGARGGFNAHVWTQAIISNYCFSFQFPHRDGGPTRRTRSNPLQSAGIIGPGVRGRARARTGPAFISM